MASASKNQKDLSYAFSVSDTAPAFPVETGQAVAEQADLIRPLAGGGTPSVSFEGLGDPDIHSAQPYEGTWNADFGPDGPSATDSLIITVTRPGYLPFTCPVITDQAVAIVIEGVDYGTILLASDGTFTYTPTYETNNMVRFSLAAVDSDGDVAHSETVSVAVTDLESGNGISHLGGDVTIDEANLPGGTNPDGSALEKRITLEEDCYIRTEMGGWVEEQGIFILKSTPKYDNDGRQINGFGELHYDAASRTLTYVLNGPAPHGEGQDMGTDVFYGVMVGNDTRTRYPLDVIINIKDDEPVVEFGDPGVTAIESGDVFVGTWSYNYGADGVDINNTTLRVSDGTHEAVFQIQYWHPVDVIVGGVFYGQAMVTDAGEYVFRAMPNTKGELNLNIGITDGDGDYRQADGGTHISIVPATPPDLSDFGCKPDEWWSEAYLPQGSEGLDWNQLTKYIEIPEGYRLDLAGWIHIGGEGDIYQMNGHFGHLKYSPEWNALAYQLITRADHPNAGASGANDVVTDDFPVAVMDTLGNIWGTSLKLQVRDDAPSVEFGASDGEATSGYEFEGVWQAGFGADGPASEKPLVLTVNNGTGSADISLLPDSATEIRIGGVTYGTLTLHSGSGKFTFLPVADITGKLSFVLAATDGDGDRAVSNDGKGFEITITPPIPPVTELTSSEHFNEANLPQGTSGNSQALTKVIDIPEHYSPVTSASEGWTQSGSSFTKTMANGYLRYEKGELTFTLTSAAQHGAAGRDSLEINAGQIKLVDIKGNPCLVDVIIPIDDDVPLAPSAASHNTVADGTLVSGTLNFIYGADGKADVNHLVIQGHSPVGPAEDGKLIYALKTGTLVLNIETGAYVYQANGLGLNQKNATETITLTARDGDGDNASTTLTFNVSKPAPGYEGDAAASVDEAGLDGRNGKPAGSLAHTDLEYGAINLPAGWKVVDAGNTSVDYGKVVMKDGSWVFELTQAIKHVAPTAGSANRNTNTASALKQPTVIAEDQYGNQFELPVNVTVIDDVLAGGNFYGSTLWRTEHGNCDLFYDYSGTISFQYGSTAGAGTMLSSSSQFSGMGIKSIKASMLQLNNDGSIVERTDLRTGSLYRNGDGLLVKGSAIDKTNDRYNELNYRPVYEINGKEHMFGMTTPVPNINGKTPIYGLSEAVVMDLDGLATTIQLKLSEFYGSERESGQIVFYRYNQETKAYDEVTRQKFSNDPSDKNGYFSKEIDITPGVFDRVVIMCTDNGNRGSQHDYDNSDFNIQSVKFPATSVIHYEQGQLSGVGADGVAKDSYVFDVKTGDTIRTTNGQIRLSFALNRDGSADKTHIIGTGPDGNKSFEAFLTKDGQWDYFQYKTFTAVDAKGNPIPMPLRFGMMDTDGDYTYANISIVNGNFTPTFELDESGLNIGSDPAGGGAIAVGSCRNTQCPNANRIDWNISSITPAKADGNLDGEYANIFWSSQNGILVGRADGVDVIRLNPTFEKGIFTGAVTAELLRPLQHGSADQLNLNIGYTQYNAAGKKATGSIVLSIKDDAPGFTEIKAVTLDGEAGTGDLLNGILASADKATISRIEVNGTTYTLNVNSSDGPRTQDILLSNGDKLVVYADGRYVITGAHMGSLSDKLRVTVTDADGDSSTSGSISLGLSGARPSLPPTPIPPSTEGGIHLGTDGKDTLTGGAGNDLFVGGKGNDLMTGGAGTDIFVFRPGEGNDTISDFDRSEGDALVMIGGGNYGQITGSYIPQDIHVVTTMVQGHDIDLSNSVSSHLLLGAGKNGNGSSQLDNSLAGGKGNDVIFGGEGDNYLRGNEGHDYIVGGSGKDIISGGEGNDTIYGGGGDDFIMGDSGNDFINAGSGENTIYGGQGADTFAWNKDSLGGKDIIGDFIPADGDKLSFTNLLSQGESLDAFFAEHIKGVTFDGTNSLAFTITDDGLSRDVQIAFSPTDPQFAAVVDAYNAASSVAEETQVLTSFLLSITTH